LNCVHNDQRVSDAADECGVDVVEGRRHAAEDHSAGRRVVGDGVEDGDVPVADARVDDLKRRQQEVHGAHGIGNGHAGAVQR
jgi:hypothetical protein